MEYLVTMTTRVPAGTSDDAVDDVRAREAARSSELANQGHLLRLWRPPLRPGEWRTLGLFAADDDRQLEKVLTSMPLRIWRTDEVTPLSPHPNDPALSRSMPLSVKPSQGRESVEFLTALSITVPDGTPPQVVDNIKEREARRAHDLATQERLIRLWTPPNRPGQWRTFGVWRAQDEADLTATLESLPLYVWMTVVTTPLTPHPHDPVTGRRS